MHGDAGRDWTFGGLWPYQPRWFDTLAGRMHYIDEGPRDGRPVVLVHGNPTWGFLYRNFIGPLVDAGCRVIVPDHLGFGRSDKPEHPALFGIADHCRRLDLLLESLDLSGAVVVPHGWGGPIGLSWAVAHPERIGGLFILNSFAHRTRSGTFPRLPVAIMRTPGLGGVLVKDLALLHRGFLFRAGVAQRQRLTPEIRQAYLTPHRTRASRSAVLAFPRQLPRRGTGQVAELAAGIETGLEREFRDRPITIAWGMRDPGLREGVLEELWGRTFPEADVMRLNDASHYVQEDAHERIVPALIGYLSRL